MPNSYYVICGIKQGAHAENEYQIPIDVTVFEKDTAKEIELKLIGEIEKYMGLDPDNDRYKIRFIGIFLLKLSRYN